MSARALLYCAGGGIGDSLTATVVARALRQRYDAVDALTLPAHREALERVRGVDDVLCDEGDAESEFAQRIAQRSYDATVVTWATPRAARVAQRAAIPVRVGQSRRLYSWRFTHRVNVRSELGDVTSHWSQILLDYARALDCDTTQTVPPFQPTAQDERQAGDLLYELGLAHRGFALLHPSNAIATQRPSWPLQGWTALAKAMRARFSTTVLVTGSHSEGGIAGRIARDAGAISVAGKTNIGALGALAKEARFFTGITTGSMHVAAAVGAPTVGIFPFQSDTPDRWRPLGRATAIVRPSYPCRAGERKETCPDYACVANLDVERIITTMESLEDA